MPFTTTLTLKVPNTQMVGLEVDGVASTDYVLNGKVLTVNGTGNQMKVTYLAGYR